MDLRALSQSRDATDAEWQSRIREMRDHLSALARESQAHSDPVYAKLEVLGLASAARAYSQRRCAEEGVTLDFEATDVPGDLPREVAVTLFRVLQEGLDNALRYARTPNITVSLRGTASAIELDVVDQGVGFDPATAAKSGGLGLVGTCERLRLLGGTCAIQSSPGAGTQIHARVPLTSNP